MVDGCFDYVVVVFFVVGEFELLVLALIMLFLFWWLFVSLSYWLLLCSVLMSLRWL